MKKTDKKVIVGIAGATVIAATGALCLFGAQNQEKTLNYRYKTTGEEVFEPTTFTDSDSMKLKDKTGYHYTVTKDPDKESYTAWYYKAKEISEAEKRAGVHHDTYAIVTDDAGELSTVENISDGPVNSHVEDPDNRPTGTNVPDGPTVSNP